MKELWKDTRLSENDNKKVWLKTSINRHNGQRVLPVIALLFLLFLPLWMLSTTESLSILQISVIWLFVSCFLPIVFILRRKQAIVFYSANSLLLVALSIIGSLPAACLISFLAVNWTSMLISQKITGRFIRDLEENYEEMNRLQNEAQIDWLTGILNRNGLEKKIDATWVFCKRCKKTVAFIMVDIDHFKVYNDAWGHGKGDNILRSVANCIQACFKRETDIVGRIGGEEFLICLINSDEEDILAMTQSLSSRIIDLKIRSPDANEYFEFLTVSIGVAICVPQNHNTKQDLYDEADREMYHAKNNGRNCISFSGQIIKDQGQ